jgi:hypothetical protein
LNMVKSYLHRQRAEVDGADVDTGKVAGREALATPAPYLLLRQAAKRSAPLDERASAQCNHKTEKLHSRHLCAVTVGHSAAWGHSVRMRVEKVLALRSRAVATCTLSQFT